MLVKSSDSLKGEKKNYKRNGIMPIGYLRQLICFIHFSRFQRPWLCFTVTIAQGQNLLIRVDTNSVFHLE